ncbi:hypothetical protein [Pseudoalteromonas ulvae]|nr:hypothetical protein [Pseudoalteromonas ulvae]
MNNIDVMIFTGNTSRAQKAQQSKQFKSLVRKTAALALVALSLTILLGA